MSRPRKHILRKIRRVSTYEVMNDGSWIAKQILESSRMDEGEEVPKYQRILSKAWVEVLTNTQRRYLYLYYAQGKKQAEIAAECGVAPCTVSRTIQRGKERLMGILRYC